MTTEEALEFLRQHQPMPDDEMLAEETIGRYDEVRRHFLSSPDERSIPLFLNSFGGGDGFGVYQLVGDTLAAYPREIVTTHLASALSSASRNVRYWAAEIAASYPSPELAMPLRLLLGEDEDLAAAAVLALGQLGTSEATDILKSALEGEISQHVRTLVLEQL